MARLFDRHGTEVNVADEKVERLLASGFTKPAPAKKAAAKKAAAKKSK